jgi:hypothetical protein
MRTPTWLAVIAAVVACTDVTDPSEPRFTRLAAGVVRDTHTALVWTAHDTGRELSWPDADGHCRALARESGGPGWRLPSIEELATLYDTSMEQPCAETATCLIDPAIVLSSPYQWSATAPQADRRVYYDFAHGSQLAPLIRPTLTRRALCTHARGGDDRA